MGKFRSKLKGKSKGKRWQKGQSSNSNPKIQKYREMAKSRFFQENLGSTGLTQQAVLKHDAMMTYGHSTGKQKSESENELAIAKDFESMSMRSGDEGTETEYTGSMRSGTLRTFQTFASDWSQCSNVSFSKLLNRFDSNNAIHKDMLAVLAAVTEVIKEQGGKETSTEYFAALMQTLKASEDDTSLVATLSLLSMDIKSVSQAVLRKQFSDSATIFIELLEKNAQSENGTLLRSIIGCLSVLLRAQEYAAWGDSSTMKVFDSVLAFVLHSKPKVRKSAQHAITAILRGSCFMLPTEDDKVKVPKLHPASNRVAEYCLSQIKPEALLSGHRPVLHILTMLRDVLPVFSKDYIKTICESILSLMAHNNIYIKTCCMHTLHALFLAGGNLSGVLAAQLSRALLAARPPANDTGQSLAWAAVVQQALCCLARLDLNLCLPNLPAFVTVCVTELWHSDVTDINAAATNALKALLFDCVKPALETEECFIKHKSHIDNIFKTIGTGLDNPFNQALKHVIMTLAVCFEALLFDCVKPALETEECFIKHKSHIDNIFKTIGTGLDNPFNQALKHVIMTLAVCFEIGNTKLTYILGPLLMKLNERKESHNFNHHKEVEYATGCAVKALGPEFVLTYIPLRDGTDINLDRSWLLPVLREKIINSNLKYFATEILDMATFCRKKSREYAQNNDNAKAHTYELLCNQFWSLLPSFCNNPKDIKDNFKTIARVLGNVLKDNPEFRLSVMQALRKLITCSNDDEDQKELGRFAKNYLPILLNIYMTPAKGGEGEGQRLAALETIQIYLTITDQNVREELYKNAITQLEASVDNHFQRESILDIIRLLILYQTHKEIAVLFDKWVFPLCETVIDDPKKYKKAKKDKMEEDGETKPLKYKEKVKLIEMEHKKAYRILEEIFKSGKDSCQQFVKDNYKKIKKMLMNSLNKVADSSKAARLRCIEHLINSSHFLNSESKLIKSAVAESVVCTKDINSKCRQCAFNVINTVGNLLKTQDGGMKSFLEMLSSGLSAPVPRVVCATLRALASALFTFSEDMGLETVQTLLDTVAHKMLENNREVVAGAMSFLKVYTKVLPTEVLAGSLPLIFRTLSKMSEDCKRHARLEVGYFLARMTRKYGADTIEKLVPPEDEVMLKRLRNVRKLENRKKRVKEQKRSQTDSDSDGDMAVKGTSQTLEDILKDSDSEMEYLDEETKPKKAKRTNKAWIQDDVEEIVDLADVSAARKITATDPTKKKRRYDDILSIKSGRSIRSKASTASKYKAGGKGIHRPLGSGASVTSAGTEYRSKKAKGDIKKKGKPDPYAYLPLSRNNLNKRKKAITSKQFKGIVKSKTKNLKVKSKRK
ncbi:RRP12-like protein [Papilio xuthus]|uniref:RRP12-like protein n=1 Tax=Papilio xuthus TaxID=66420 RepID=A0A194Q165_PAPXU|nr:RRP12-like protein [Papilio xuthus]